MTSPAPHREDSFTAVAVPGEHRWRPVLALCADPHGIEAARPTQLLASHFRRPYAAGCSRRLGQCAGFPPCSRSSRCCTPARLRPPSCGRSCSTRVLRLRGAGRGRAGGPRRQAGTVGRPESDPGLGVPGQPQARYSGDERKGGLTGDRPAESARAADSRATTDGTDALAEPVKRCAAQPLLRAFWQD